MGGIRVEIKTIRTIKSYLFCIIIFQIIFLIEVFAFHDCIIAPNHFFRITTLSEWHWLLQQEPTPYGMGIILISDLLQDIFIVVFIVGIFQLFYVKQKILPIRTLWKIVIPVAGLIMYLPCFYYFKYQAEHYRLYITIIPGEILSLIFLCLILIGLAGKRKNDGNVIK